MCGNTLNHDCQLVSNLCAKCVMTNLLNGLHKWIMHQLFHATEHFEMLTALCVMHVNKLNIVATTSQSVVAFQVCKPSQQMSTFSSTLAAQAPSKVTSPWTRKWLLTFSNLKVSAHKI